MKVLFYINAIHHGGAERVMVNLTKELSYRGVECVLVTSFYDEWEYPTSENVKRLSLYPSQINGSVLVRNIKLIKKLRSIVKSEKPNIVLSFMAEPNFRNILSTLGLNVVNVVSVRNDPNKEYPNIIFRIFAKVLYCFANGVVFQTKEAQNWFSKRIQNKSIVIYNPVEKSFYEAESQDTKYNIVTTGRLTLQKNHKLLIKAFSKVANDIDEDLYIYGDGELKSELLSYISQLNLGNRVFLPGPTKDVISVLQKCKLFVLSSDFEGMPNSLMEAMAMGVPCISTDCPSGGPKELFGKDGECYLTTVGDEDGLALLMKSIVSDDEEQIKNSLYMKRKANDFKTEIVIDKWHKYLMTFVGE